MAKINSLFVLHKEFKFFREKKVEKYFLRVKKVMEIWLIRSSVSFDYFLSFTNLISRKMY